MQASIDQAQNTEIIDRFELQIDTYNQDQIIDKFFKNFKNTLPFKHSYSNQQSHVQLHQKHHQIDQPFQRIVQQIRNLSQQTNNNWFIPQPYQQQQIDFLSAPQPNQIQYTIQKIKENLPSTISFQQLIREAYHKYSNSQNKADCLNQDQLELDYKLINNQPLYQIDYSSKFYNHNQQMSKILHEYTTIVTYLCQEGIKQQNLKSGVHINQKMILTGQQLCTKIAIIFKTTYRKLQQDIDNIYKGIIRLEGQDLKILYKLLFNYQQYLTNQQLTIWFNLIKKSFNLPSNVTQTQIINIYRIFISLIKDYRQQQQSIDYNLSKQSNKIIWNQEIERDMCRIYLIHKRIRVLLQQLNRKYSKIKEDQFVVYTQRFLRSRIEGIVVKTLKKVQRLIQQNRLRPQLRRFTKGQIAQNHLKISSSPANKIATYKFESQFTNYP